MRALVAVSMKKISQVFIGFIIWCFGMYEVLLGLSGDEMRIGKSLTSTFIESPVLFSLAMIIYFAIILYPFGLLLLAVRKRYGEYGGNYNINTTKQVVGSVFKHRN